VCAYYYLSLFGFGSFDNSFSNGFDIGTHTRLEELTKLKFDGQFISCWQAVDNAYEISCLYLKKDTTFLKLN